MWYTVHMFAFVFPLFHHHLHTIPIGYRLDFIYHFFCENFACILFPSKRIRLRIRHTTILLDPPHSFSTLMVQFRFLSIFFIISSTVRYFTISNLIHFTSNQFGISIFQCIFFSFLSFSTPLTTGNIIVSSRRRRKKL